MTDPLSLTASLVAVASAAIATSKLVFRVGNTIVGAQRQINELAQGLVHFDSVLRTLSRVIESAPKVLNRDGVQDAKRICRNCSTIVKEIRRVFTKLEKDSLDVLDRIKWVFKRDSLRYPRARLESVKTDLMLIIEILNLAVNLKQMSSIHSPVVTQQYETVKLNIAVSFANDEELGQSELVEEQSGILDPNESKHQSDTSTLHNKAALVRIHDTRDQGHFGGLCVEHSLSVTCSLNWNAAVSAQSTVSTAYQKMEDHAADLVPWLLNRWTSTSGAEGVSTAMPAGTTDHAQEAEPAAKSNGTASRDSHRQPVSPRRDGPGRTAHSRARVPAYAPPENQHGEGAGSYNSDELESVDSDICDNEDSIAAQPLTIKSHGPLESWNVRKFASKKAVSGNPSLKVFVYTLFQWPKQGELNEASVSSLTLANLHRPPWEFNYKDALDEPMLVFKFVLGSFLPRGPVFTNLTEAMMKQCAWFAAPLSACKSWKRQKCGSRIVSPGVSTIIKAFWSFMIALGQRNGMPEETLRMLNERYHSNIDAGNYALYKTSFRRMMEYEDQKLWPHLDLPPSYSEKFAKHDWSSFMLGRGTMSQALEMVVNCTNYYVEIVPGRLLQEASQQARS